MATMWSPLRLSHDVYALQPSRGSLGRKACLATKLSLPRYLFLGAVVLEAVEIC